LVLWVSPEKDVAPQRQKQFRTGIGTCKEYDCADGRQRLGGARADLLRKHALHDKATLTMGKEEGAFVLFERQLKGRPQL
jgi:hypothetical protein